MKRWCLFFLLLATASSAGSEIGKRVLIATNSPEDKALSAISAEGDLQKKVPMCEDFIQKFAGSDPVLVALEMLQADYTKARGYLKLWETVVAYVILLIQLPIPIFWAFVHPFTDFWRGRARFAYTFVGIPVWGLVTIALLHFRGLLFVPGAAAGVAFWRVLIGFLLIGLHLWLMGKVKSDLGWRRLVGLVELGPSAAPAAQRLSDQGIYGSMRHPVYAGMILSVTGAWLLVGTPTLAAVLAAWLVVVLIIVQLEERELHRRFGAAYEEYARCVPRFLPRSRRAGCR